MNFLSWMAHNHPAVYCLESLSFIVLFVMELYVSSLNLQREGERASFCVHAQERLSIFLAAGLHKGSRMSSSVIAHCDNCNTFSSGLGSENLFSLF